MKENTYKTDPLKKDTDDDGLADIFETAGMLLPNGKIIYTDPLKWDTDGDGLSDGEEIYIGGYETIDVKINEDGSYEFYYAPSVQFYMLSDPNSIDYDGDGLFDYEDPYPYNFNTYIRYDRDAVVNYCDVYYDKPNIGLFYYFYDGDCANFASQCINAGGIPMNKDWYFNSAGDSIFDHRINEDYTLSWTVAYENYNYFKDNHNISNGEVIKFNSKQDMQNSISHHEYNIQAGDLMYMQWEHDIPHHAVVIDGIDYMKNTITYSGHTDSRNHDDVIERFWNENPNGKIFIIRIKDVIITL